MTTSNGNIVGVTEPLWGEASGHRWISNTKASDAELWCILWSEPEKNSWANKRDAGHLRRHRAHYVAARHQAITWANTAPDLCLDGVLLAPNVLSVAVFNTSRLRL